VAVMNGLVALPVAGAVRWAMRNGPPDRAFAATGSR
jgi:hypothetical protein